LFLLYISSNFFADTSVVKVLVGIMSKGVEFRKWSSRLKRQYLWNKTSYW